MRPFRRVSIVFVLFTTTVLRRERSRARLATPPSGTCQPFERDNLDWQSRELATVGALAATPGMESQLRSHMAASLRVGLTAAQLRQLTQLLAERGDAQAARRATEALTQALAAVKGAGA